MIQLGSLAKKKREPVWNYFMRVFLFSQWLFFF